MFSLFISLETPLAVGNVLKFTFPESNFAATNTLIVTAGSTLPTSGTTAYTAASLGTSATGGVVTVTLASALSANTWYQVCLVLGTSYVSA